jgi:hypothetical protein
LLGASNVQQQRLSAHLDGGKAATLLQSALACQNVKGPSSRAFRQEAVDFRVLFRAAVAENEPEMNGKTIIFYKM